MIFTIALGAVLVLLLMAAVGYILAKCRVFDGNFTSDLSKILVYVCQPALAVYTFKSTEYSPEKLTNVGIFALLVLAINVLVMGASYLIFKKKSKNPIYRIMTIATAMANCAFFGIPIIEAILPTEAPDLILYTTVFSVIMNIIGWTIGSAIISQNLKYVSVKKMITNPALIGTVVALILFVFEIPIENLTSVFSLITTCAKMATPLSMIIMGARLATMDIPSMFNDGRVYLTIAIKQFAMPLIAFAMVFFLPLPAEIAKTFFIICACPVASVVLNYSEIVGEGQKEAAKMVLVGTILSVVTLPIMMLLLPLL